MASEFCMWQEASGQRRLEPGPDASLEVSRVTCGFLCIPTSMPLGLLVFDLPSQRSRGTCETSKAGSQTEVWVRSDSQAAFWGGGESIPAVKLGEGSWKSLPSPAGWRGERVRSRAAWAAADPARCQLSPPRSRPASANCAEGITRLLGAAEPLRKCFCLCSTARFPMLLGTGSQLSCLLVCLY